MACPLKLKNSLVPSHFALDAHALLATRDVGGVEEGGVEEQAAASVISARPSPRNRSERSARITATTAAQRGADEAADEQVEPEVVGQLGGGEGTHPGQASPGTARAGPPCP